ncbi:MAG: two-component system response regulator [Paenibacillus sp.]|jgi:two-component system response regulator YesN|nr:two-component system response regulator [Paenibacillus sp.]
MWKILFVEDEPFVRRSLIQLIDWRSRGFEIIGEADDGVEALEQIQNQQPDLVISDIIMPNMNGIELLRHAKEGGYEGLFIMLTCMNEFEYARQALEYGAFGYELKLSMSPQSINQMLAKVNTELSRRALLRSQIDYHQAYESVWDWIAVQSGDPQTIDANRRRMWEGSRYRYVSVCSVFHGNEPFNQGQFAEWFGPETAPGPDLHSFSAYGVTSLFGWSDRHFKLKQPQAVSTPYSVICSEAVKAEQFPHIWMDVLRQLNRHWYKGRPGIYWLRSDTEEPSAADPLSWKREMELYQLIEAGKTAPAAQLLRDAWTEMEQAGVSWVTVKEAAYRIARWLQKQLPSLAPKLPQRIADSQGHAELYEIMSETVEHYVKEHDKESYPVTDHPEINMVIRYMHEHYKENVTLKALAKLINMDEKYVSGLFAKKMGEPMVQYLQHIRIDKAKQLLTHSALPVNEIGELVGFANANYFFKIFKRWSNLTPNDYRKLYGDKLRS